MMIHHSNENYAVAATRAAEGARAKLQALIAKGAQSASKTVDKVFTAVPCDALVRDQVLLLDVDGNQVYAAAPGLEPQPLTDHALQQVCSRAGLPAKFAKECLASENTHVRNLVSENLETLLRSGPDNKALVRSVDNKIHAVLSDSYRRMDSRPLLESFMVASDAAGLVPVQGTYTDTKVSMRMVLPTIYEPVSNEVMVFGLDWNNSDFGCGTHSVTAFMLRLWCTNTALVEKALRQVHLGKRLDEMTFSQKTYALDSETQASALNDIVRNALSAERVQQYCDVIKEADANKIEAHKYLDLMAKRGEILKSEAKAITEKFNSPDVEMLPPGNTTWRLSNAISWYAHAGEHTADRRMELERTAGNVLPTISRA